MLDFSAGIALSDRSRPRGVGLYAAGLKRCFDLVVALLLMPVVLPLLACLCLVALSRGGPCFFGHDRVGRGGRMFRCWKIRTMVPDAQARLDQLLAQDATAAAEWLRTRKLRRDPRVTGFGHVLRRSSLDELPQIWNVLKGEMSLIGPRPVTRAEMAYYGAHQGDYLALRPGITGLWQVSGRNSVSYDRRVALDVEYARGLSFLTDLRILLRTAAVVLARSGA
ncbi:sugar transferase [Pseudooceanicola sp.]|uniref:sugar transferase n=1 Tax=Pseudooceanicola sp. TaxID=1914328 RepID=UPI0035C6A173